MAQSKLELAVDTGKWDAGLKKGQQALNAFTQAQGGFQQALQKDNGYMQSFIQMMGKMDSTASTAKGQMNDYKRVLEQLTADYNKMSEAQRKSIGTDYLQTIDALKQKFQAAKQQVDEFNRSLGNTSEIKLPEGGGLFGGGKFDGMLQVFGGNIMTKGFEMAKGAITSMVNETATMIKQGVELAKQGEGIRIAFERLGRGDILDGLREATHGTVTDIELMKAAVKFNDFKLPVEELGTMLAFAQQKAKDTGQSVDYMVDSIVTGLGRKSLMILDNLGLSAAEIKERMKETGDMTKAVGAIIREQMAAAGDYVETAADRALQANVSLQNKMEELGRKFAPIEEASNQLWTSMKIGILDIIGGPLATLLNQLTEAGRMKNALQGMGGNEQVNGQLGKLRVAKAAGSGYMTRSLYSEQVEQYNRQINAADTYLKQYDSNHSAVNTVLMAASKQFGQKFDSISDLKAFRDAYVSMKSEYVKGAQEIMKVSTSTNTTTKSVSGIGELKKQLKELEDQRKKAVLAGDNELVENLTKQINSVKQNISYLDPKALKTGSTKTEKTEIQKNEEQIKKLSLEYAKLGDVETEASRKRQEEIKKEIELLQQRNGLLGLRMEQAQGRLLTSAGDFDRDTKKVGGVGMLDQATNFGKKIEIPSGGLQLSDKLMSIVGKQIEDQNDRVIKAAKERAKNDDGITKLSKGISGLNSITGGLEKMGIEIPSEIQSLIGVIEGVMAVIQGVQTIIGITQTTALTANTAAIISLEAAIWANTASSWFPFANGGIVHAANGWVGGSRYSGDNVPALLNSGELILNRAQQGVLADALEGGGIGNLGLSVKVTAEELRFILGNNSRRRGKGEYVTTNRLR